MGYAMRIHLKTSCKNREKLIDFCLKGENQYLAIGWSYVYPLDENMKAIASYQDYYRVVKSIEKRVNHALNVFMRAGEDDLFWTRDLNGCYWICRATGTAQSYFDASLDIGAVLPIEAYKVGLDVPGQIKASFNRPRGGTAESIKSESIAEFSKYIFNLSSGRDFYKYEEINGDFLDNLPASELEELVIAYLQLKENYYVLSNSIANKSTTVKVECELISRDRSNGEKAVVQVKGGHSREIDTLDYQNFSDDGYFIYLFAPKILNKDKVKNVIEITKKDLHLFYTEYKPVLPASITAWENLFSF